MRNLKKALSLAMALALLLSFSSAVFAVEFTDSSTDPITAKYQDAVDMMYELDIMKGYDDGAFRPSASLTRAQYLKMLYVVTNNGNDDLAAQYKNLTPFPFTDVYAGAWYEGYVKAGYGRGWVGGYGDGTFQPDGEVNGFEALKLSLVALGYDSVKEGYGGVGSEEWKYNVLADAQDAGLLVNLDSVSNFDEALSREAAAQLLFNTLFASTVRYNTNYVPEVMEKGETMATKYYSLYVLQGVVTANEWATVESAKAQSGETTLYVDASNLPRDSSGNYIGSGVISTSTGNTFQLPYVAPMEMLGKSVSLYVRYSNPYSVKPFDKVYGSMRELSLNQIKTVTTEAIISTYGTTATQATNTNFAWIVQESMGLLPTKFDTVTGRTIGNKMVVNYGTPVDADTGIAAWATTIKAGTEATAIDNNNDGVWDYLIISEKNYAKVTIVTDDKNITAINGDGADFLGARIINAKASSDIYNSEDLKVDDRIIWYTIGSDDWGVTVVEPMKGTLTASRSNGTVALVSGTEYGQSPLVTRVTDISEVLQTANFNVEKDYYIYGGKVVEGPEPSGAAKMWALVKESYAASNLLSDNRKVALLFEDGTSGTYDVSAAYYVNGTTETKVDVSKTSATEDTITLGAPASIELLKTGTGTNDGTLVGGVIVKASVSEDETGVTLYYYGADTAIDDTTSRYVADANTITLTTVASTLTKNVLADSVFFVYRGASDGVTEAFGVYKGRNLPAFTANGVTTNAASVVYANSHAIFRNVGGDVVADGTSIAAALIGSGTTKVSTVSNSRFGYVLADPSVYHISGSDYYFEVTVYDAKDEAVKTYKGATGIRGTTGTYNEDRVNSPTDGLAPNTTGGYNIGFAGDAIVEFSLNAAGDINSVAVMGNIENAIPTTGAENSYIGFITVQDASWIRYYQADPFGVAASDDYPAIDANWAYIDGDSSHKRSSASIGTVSGENAQKVAIIYNADDEVEVIFYLGSSTTDVKSAAITYVNTYTNAGSVTVAILEAAGATNVIAGNLGAYQTALAANTATPPVLFDTTAEIQTMVNTENGTARTLTNVANGTYTMVATTTPSANEFTYNTTTDTLLINDGTSTSTINPTASGALDLFLSSLATGNSFYLTNGLVDSLTAATATLDTSIVAASLEIVGDATLSGTANALSLAGGANTYDLSSLTSGAVSNIATVTALTMNGSDLTLGANVDTLTLNGGGLTIGLYTITDLTVNSGTYTAANIGNLTGTLTVDGGTVATGTVAGAVTVNGGTATTGAVSAAVTVNGGTATIDSIGAFALIVNGGDVTVTGAADDAVTVNNDGTVSVGGTIGGALTINSSANHDLTTDFDAVTGTITLSGTGTYTLADGKAVTLAGATNLDLTALDDGKSVAVTYAGTETVTYKIATNTYTLNTTNSAAPLINSSATSNGLKYTFTSNGGDVTLGSVGAISEITATPSTSGAIITISVADGDL